MTPAPENGPELHSDRLLLRRWRPEDLEPLAAMNADPEVMRCLPAQLSREESDAVAERIERHFEAHGFGFWAVEAPGIAPFIGFVGLANVGFEAPFTPAVEIGWRLARPFWGSGYATEAARAALTFGFNRLRLPEIVAFTVPANARSRRVMERIGMSHDPADDFDHPALAPGHPLRRHVLYRIAAPQPEFRRAVPGQAAMLTEVGKEAKAHWGYSAEFMAAWEVDLAVTEDFILRGNIEYAVVGDDVAGFYGTIAREGGFELEHLWVRPQYMGRGIGRALFERAIGGLRSAGGGELHIVADPDAEGFYRRMGARVVGHKPTKIPGRTLPVLVLDVDGRNGA